jgi:hypothetical protein
VFNKILARLESIEIEDPSVLETSSINSIITLLVEIQEAIEV